jgi:hypothetical protein
MNRIQRLVDVFDLLAHPQGLGLVVSHRFLDLLQAHKTLDLGKIDSNAFDDSDKDGVLASDLMSCYQKCSSVKRILCYVPERVASLWKFLL